MLLCLGSLVTGGRNSVVLLTYFNLSSILPNSIFPIYHTLGTEFPPFPCGTHSLCAWSCHWCCLTNRSMRCHISEADNRKTLSYALLADCAWLKLKATFKYQNTLLSRVTSVGSQESLRIINKAHGRFAVTTKLSGLECCYVHLLASKFPTGLRIFLCPFANTARGVTCN
jgi:hypothetical protein